MVPLSSTQVLYICSMLLAEEMVAGVCPRLCPLACAAPVPNCPLSSFVAGLTGVTGLLGVSDLADSWSVGSDPSGTESADTESGDAGGVAVVSSVNAWMSASISESAGSSSAIATPTAHGCKLMML